MVLVVDDDPDLRVLAEIQLGDRFDVVTASNGEECLRVAQDRPPNVILLDMLMPGMDGAQVMEQLAVDPKTRDIPVIFLSALSSPLEKVKGLDSGAVDFISKPANTDEFIARVTAAARIDARQQELRRSTKNDQLTGVGDRKSFDTRLGQEVARAKRIGVPLAVMLFDIDNLAKINDLRGRDFGDSLLRKLATALTGTLRISDVLCRYGGDEFAAILPDAEAGTAALAAERCREAVSKMLPDRSLTLSIGVAEYSTGHTTEELLAKAEIALFRAKESGGDRTWRSDDPRRHSMNPIALAEELTDREWTVLGLLADKRSEQDIAKRMGIRPGTVRSHKARIRRKLNVSPEVRLNEFVKDNFRDLVERIGLIDVEEIAEL